MPPITVTREVKIPDPVRLERYRRLPELGPSVLFFTGGTALKGLSRELTTYTRNSIHLLTPFDSGGSSAKLRQVFNMPAVGDVRSRLMALADDSITGNPEVYALANYRLSEQATGVALLQELEDLIAGQHPLIRSVPNPMRRLIRLQLGFFREAMPEHFDLAGASIGNLILTGGYLNYQEHLDPILFLFSKLLVVQGIVRPIVNDPLHLAVQLENGETVLGQHLFTGKEVPPIASRISRMWLSGSEQVDQPAAVQLRKKVAKLIHDADLICYPPGSFYSSIIATLLPDGVGRAVARNASPKVYVPNLGVDPEQFGMSVTDSVETLLHYLRQGLGDKVEDTQLLNYVLVDNELSRYDAGLSRSWFRKRGIELIQTELVTEASAPYYDNARLAQALLSLT
ncbi:MAG: GAK system CofD-like protein [Pseudomonadales bacterium]|nr:GAK system CofD-like protein [Pseudomonadales bacterium]